MKRTQGEIGAPAFDAFYRRIYGERWDGLAAALAASPRAVGLRVRQAGGYDLLEPSNPVEDASQTGPTVIYYLDPASVDAAAAVDLPLDGQVLDACAAPGGKSLVLAARLPVLSHLLCNELSAQRRRRLVSVLDASLPPDIRARVSVFGADAASLCLRRPSAFNAILLDAPCSSERHVLQDAAALAAWTPSRPKSLAARQWALLSSAFLMLAPGGCLVYSTCSINPVENDGVVERLLAKRGDGVSLDPPQLSGSEATKYGLISLPDRAGGSGPLYVCKLRKASPAST